MDSDIIPQRGNSTETEDVLSLRSEATSVHAERCIMNLNEDALAKLLKQISSTDKTPPYRYHSEEEAGNYLNADGNPPRTGYRWNTPREICNIYLRDIEQGTLEAAIDCLMEADL